MHYLFIALYATRRTRLLTALMVLTIAFGIACSATMFTVLRNLAGNPLPERSASLFHPQIDPRPVQEAARDAAPPDNLTYLDAINLLKIGDPAVPKVATSSNWLPAKRDGSDRDLAMFTTRATTEGFFRMFGVPFLYGHPWSAEDDEDHVAYVVLSRTMNDQLFGGQDSVGQTLMVGRNAFKIVGVIDHWNPQPHFYELDGNKTGAYGDAEQMYMPFTTWLDQPQDYGYGPMQCWGANRSAGDHDPRAAQCTWVQFWVQLTSTAQVRAYYDALVAYSARQHEVGRFEQAPNIRLSDLMTWLDYRQVVPSVVRMQLWIALGVLLVCLFNTVGLLAAKFQKKAGELGLRRALGASRRDVFIQCIVEAASVGLAGGLLSIPMAWAGLELFGDQPLAFATAVHLDVRMLAAAIALSVVATALCGIWPSWRASRISPSLQVKSL